MKRIITWFILLSFWMFFTGCDLWLLGTHDKGYVVEIESNSVQYETIERVETLLIQNGYEIQFRERDVKGHGIPRQPKEVYTWARKTFGNNRWVVDTYLGYVVDKGDTALIPLIRVENRYQGGKEVDIKNEIDKTAEIIYQELLRRVGKERITVKHFGKVATNQ